MEQSSEGRRHDPSRLSKSKPGRSEIQDDAPSLPRPNPDKDNRPTVGEVRRTQGVRPEEPGQEEAEDPPPP